MTLLQSLAELATDIARAAADQRLEVAEIVEIAGDLIAVGRAIRELATNPEAVARAEATRERVRARREARRVARLR